MWLNKTYILKFRGNCFWHFDSLTTQPPLELSICKISGFHNHELKYTASLILETHIGYTSVVQSSEK